MHAHASAAKRLRSSRLLGRYRRAGGLSPRVAVCPALAIRSTVSVRPTKKAHRICRSFARPSAHWTWDQPHTRMGTPTPERKTAERKRERARRICPQVHGRDDSAANFKMQATLATRALANLRKAGTFRPESGRGEGTLKWPRIPPCAGPRARAERGAAQSPRCEIFHALGAQCSRYLVAVPVGAGAGSGSP
jgi:hypothetical protein